MTLKERAKGKGERIITLDFGDGHTEEVRLRFPPYGEAKEYGKKTRISETQDPTLGDGIERAVECVQLCAVVDKAQPRLSDDEWANILVQTGGITGQLAKAANDMVLEALGVDVRALDKEGEVLDPVPFVSD